MIVPTAVRPGEPGAMDFGLKRPSQLASSAPQGQQASEPPSDNPDMRNNACLACHNSHKRCDRTAQLPCPRCFRLKKPCVKRMPKRRGRPAGVKNKKMSTAKNSPNPGRSKRPRLVSENPTPAPRPTRTRIASPDRTTGCASRVGSASRSDSASRSGSAFRTGNASGTSPTRTVCPRAVRLTLDPRTVHSDCPTPTTRPTPTISTTRPICATRSAYPIHLTLPTNKDYTSHSNYDDRLMDLSTKVPCTPVMTLEALSGFLDMMVAAQKEWVLRNASPPTVPPPVKSEYTASGIKEGCGSDSDTEDGDCASWRCRVSTTSCVNGRLATCSHLGEIMNCTM